MKKIVLAIFLFTWAVSAIGSVCQDKVNSLVRTDPWGRLLTSYWDIGFRISPLGIHQVSGRTRKAMEQLERAGGKGRYAQLEVSKGHQMRGIQILSPPKNGLYGSAFEEIFKEIDEANMLAFTFPGHKLSSIGGYAAIQNVGSTGSKAVLVFRPGIGGNLANRHELQHIRDYATQTDTFKQILPEVSESVIRLLEKVESGEALGQGEEKMILATVELFHVMGEIRASESSLRNLFTRQGFQELVFTKTWPAELMAYISEMFNVSLRNTQLLLLTVRLPGEMVPHNPVIVATKIIVFGGGHYNHFWRNQCNYNFWSLFYPGGP